jgi:hypothetical protein
MIIFTTPAALTSGKESQYPLDMKLGGAQSRSERGGEEKNPFLTTMI